MPPPRPTYLRFVIAQRDPDSHVSMGIFQAAADLRDAPANLAPHEVETFDRAWNWLKMHLKVPPILSDRGTERAISWFRAEAAKPIAHVRTLSRLLDEHGHLTRQITTQRPGRVVYEDGWQIVAYPPRDQRGRL